MDATRALELIYDLTAEYYSGSQSISDVPPQFIVYQREFSPEYDAVKILAHNALGSVLSEWPFDIADMLHELDHAEGFLFWAIVSRADDESDELLLSIFDKESGDMQSYTLGFEGTPLTAIPVPPWFEGFDFSKPYEIH